MNFPLGFKFKIEGYYKYYFSRIYVNSWVDSNNNMQYKAHSDGIAHVAGFDILLQRKLSKYIDGLLSYSFIYARYLNPTSDNNLSTDSDSNPLGKWYYPSFHRFHTFNISLNIKPLDWLTITPEFTFSSGTPKQSLVSITKSNRIDINTGESTVYYTGNYEYSDTDRSDISIPFNLKVSFHGYFPKSKVKYEVYIACQDIFAMLYSPKGTTSVYQNTGKETTSVSENYIWRHHFFQPSYSLTITMKSNRIFVSDHLVKTQN